MQSILIPTNYFLSISSSVLVTQIDIMKPGNQMFRYNNSKHLDCRNVRNDNVYVLEFLYSKLSNANQSIDCLLLRILKICKVLLYWHLWEYDSCIISRSFRSILWAVEKGQQGFQGSANSLLLFIEKIDHFLILRLNAFNLR